MKTELVGLSSKSGSPAFLTPGTSFVEDNFSTDQRGGDEGWFHVDSNVVGFTLLWESNVAADLKWSSGGNATNGEWL